MVTMELVVTAGRENAEGAAKIPANKPANGGSTLPEPSKQASSPKATAYYHYSVGHLYEELAGTYGNRSEYVNKAIENYRLAMKEDPAASFLVEAIPELYHVSWRIR